MNKILEKILALRTLQNRLENATKFKLSFSYEISEGPHGARFEVNAAGQRYRRTGLYCELHEDKDSAELARMLCALNEIATKIETDLAYVEELNEYCNRTSGEIQFTTTRRPTLQNPYADNEVVTARLHDETKTGVFYDYAVMPGKLALTLEWAAEIHARNLKQLAMENGIIICEHK